MDETRFLTLQTALPCDFTRATGGTLFPVRGRDIQAFIGSTGAYSTWAIDQNDRAGFVERRDFILLLNHQRQTGGSGGHNRKEYYYTTDAAKKICMMASTPKGNEVREYFLECERRAGVGNAHDKYDVMHQLVENARETERNVAVLSDRVTVLEVARVEDVQSHTFALQQVVERIEAERKQVVERIEAERSDRLRSEQREARRRRNARTYFKQKRFPGHVKAAFQAIWSGQDCMMPGCTEANIIRRRCFEWDHVVPSSKGGPNTIPNIGLICQWCNGEKRDHLIPDYRPIWVVRALQRQADEWAEEDAAKAAAAQQAQLSLLDSCIE